LTRVLTVDRLRPDHDAIEEAATETVYGLGGNALDPDAVARIFQAKERPAIDPLIVHIADASQLGSLVADLPAEARTLALAFWPGPLTLILPKAPVVPDLVTAGLPSVAVRVPAGAVAQALLASARVPVAAPSANRFGRPSPTRAAHVLHDLEGRVDLVLDGGPTEVGVESTIVDLTTTPPAVRRLGGVTLERLRAVCPNVVVATRYGSLDAAQQAPGQFLRHYAPLAGLTLYEGDPASVAARVAEDTRRLAGEGKRVGVLGPEEDVMAVAPLVAAQAARGRALLRAFGSRRDPERAAQTLFEALRALDLETPDVILATTVSPEGIGAAIRDRLLRAAEGRVVRVG
jgi:L-threonylcarbamoyladenylate synthase